MSQNQKASISNRHKMTATIMISKNIHHRTTSCNLRGVCVIFVRRHNREVRRAACSSCRCHFKYPYHELLYQHVRHRNPLSREERAVAVLRLEWRYEATTEWLTCRMINRWTDRRQCREWREKRVIHANQQHHPSIELVGITIEKSRHKRRKDQSSFHRSSHYCSTV